MGRHRVEEVTEKQLELLGFIVEYIEKYARQPSFEEMAERFQVSNRAIIDRLRQLERKGCIVLTGKDRGIILNGVRFKAQFDANLPWSLAGVASWAATASKK